MQRASNDARTRVSVLLVALAPAVAAFGIVAVRYARQLSDNESGSIGIAALLFGAIYLFATLFALGRGAPLSKVALAGWSAAIAFAAVFALRAAYKHVKVDPRVHADTYEGMDWVPEYFRELKASSRTHWSPYVQWNRAPFDGKYIHVDRNGLRKTWTAPGTPDDAPRIFMFGGSTLWGTGAKDNETIPSRVAYALSQAGTAVHVENFGESGYVSTQGLVRLELELRAGRVPDLVVFYDGANDCAAAAQSGQPGIPMNEERRRDDYLLGHGAEPPTSPSLPPPELAREVVALYRGNLKVLAGLADRFGFKLLCFWQPLPFIDKPLTSYEQKASSDIGEKQREMIRLVYTDIAQQELPPCFHDLRSVFARQTSPRYIDWCHLGPQGNEEVAAAMLPSIRKALGR